MTKSLCDLDGVRRGTSPSPKRGLPIVGFMMLGIALLLDESLGN